MVRARHLRSTFLREPLVHFVVLGTALFLLYDRVAPAPVREIVVPASLVQGLVRDAERRTGRTPTPAEADAMVERWIDDEVRYREALDLGLDRGDLIVRRRLVQKMDFLLEGSTPLPLPTTSELEAWLAAHPERWATPDRVTIEHVFAAHRPAGDEAARAAVWLPALADGTPPGTLGDPFLHGGTLAARSQDELANLFGAEFADAVLALPVGPWQGPIPSRYGAHAVRVTVRRPGAVPPLDAIRDRVARDWRAARREALDAQALADLRARWPVRREAAP
ncbi:MAG: peptidyl-prolyl cis-trans isomerase [bacterium]|nr:peptidyl-prolyl cis-trans isomerase [bacterium]